MLVYQRLSLSFFVFDQQKKGLPRKKSSNAGPAGHNTTSHDLPMTSATNPLVMMAWKSPMALLKMPNFEAQPLERRVAMASHGQPWPCSKMFQIICVFSASSWSISSIFISSYLIHFHSHRFYCQSFHHHSRFFRAPPPFENLQKPTARATHVGRRASEKSKGSPYVISAVSVFPRNWKAMKYIDEHISYIHT